MHRLDLGLNPHPKELVGTGVGTHVNSKGKIPSTGRLRGGWNQRCCITRDIEANTLPAPTSLFLVLLGVGRLHDQGCLGDEWSRLFQLLLAAVEFGRQGSADGPHVFS